MAQKGNNISLYHRPLNLSLSTARSSRLSLMDAVVYKLRLTWGQSKMTIPPLHQVNSNFSNLRSASCLWAVHHMQPTVQIQILSLASPWVLEASFRGKTPSVHVRTPNQGLYCHQRQHKSKRTSSDFMRPAWNLEVKPWSTCKMVQLADYNRHWPHHCAPQSNQLN